MQLSEVLNSIAQYAPNALLLVEPRGTIVFANAQAHELLGYAPDQLVGCSVDELVPAGREHAHRRLREDFAAGPEVRAMAKPRDLEARHRDGHLIPVEIFLGRLDLATTSYTVATLVDLTPRKRLEAELRLLDAVVRSARDGVVIIAAGAPGSGAREARYANQAFLTMSGYDLSEVSGAFPAILYGRRTDRATTRLIEQALAAHASTTIELLCYRKNGEEFWADLSFDPILDPRGAVTEQVAIVRDVTGRKLTETALRDSHEARETILEASLDGYFLIGTNGQIMNANPAYVRQSGYTREELIGMSLSNIEARESTREIAAHMKRIVATGSDQFETEHRRKDGSIWPVEASVVYDYDATKGGVYHVFVRDITERKRSEADLRAREVHLRTIIETEPDGVGVLAKDNTVLHMNAAGLAMFEVGTIGQLNELGVASFLRPDHGEALRTLWERVTSTRRATVELEIVGRKGTRRWLEIHAAPMRDGTGAITALLGIARDVTSQKRLERELLETTSRERRKLSEEMHDGLGQELTGLSLLLRALASSSRAGRPPDAETIDRLLTISQQAIKTCRSIARGLSPLNDAHGGLIQALRDMVSLHRDNSGEAVEFEAIESARLRLPADVLDHLYRIAQEAVTNARKHAQAKTIRMTLSILADVVSLEVADDGVGIEVTTQGADGLGLRNMRHRAQMIGAELTVGPRAGGGTRLACQISQPI